MTSSKVNPKRPGRPPTGRGTLVGVRFQPDLLAEIDRIAARSDPALTRPEAVRALVQKGLDESD